MRIIGFQWTDYVGGHGRQVWFFWKTCRVRNNIHSSATGSGLESSNTSPILGTRSINYRLVALVVLSLAWGCVWTGTPATFTPKFLRRLVSGVWRLLTCNSGCWPMISMWIAGKALTIRCCCHFGSWRWLITSGYQICGFFGPWIDVFAWTGMGLQ